MRINSIILTSHLHFFLFISSSNDFVQPRWQQTPIVPIPVGSPFNWDGFQYKALAHAWDIVKQEKSVVISYIRNIPTPEDADLNVEENNRYISKFVGNNTSYYTEPFGDIFYPIVKNIYEGITPDSNISTNGIVGILSVSYFWRDILKNMKSEKRDGLHVVVENSCNQTFTYTWSDSEPVYLGSGDLHESAFDHLKQSFSLTDIGDSNMYTGLPLSSKGCQYVIHTYPSFDMLENYHANEAR